MISFLSAIPVFFLSWLRFFCVSHKIADNVWMKAVKQFDILIFHIFLKRGIFLFPGIISIDILPAMC